MNADKITIPPIKSQGIKSKLIPWISGILPPCTGRWIEPFMGTGVVGFNLAENTAIMSDTNPYIIDFYSKIYSNNLTPERIRFFLEDEGNKLIKKGDIYFYEVRERFNVEKSPLDFLFINRSCFNGMIRFNKKGNYNTPYCHKDNRFSKSYVTKIVNQVYHILNIFRSKEFSFVCQDFEKTILNSNADDLIYCDPPYIDRYVDYYNGWDDYDEEKLFNLLSNTKSKFILSTWHHNSYRKNKYIDIFWSKFNILTKDHFYHLGGKEENRNAMVEALVTNFEIIERNRTLPKKTHNITQQLNLF